MGYIKNKLFTSATAGGGILLFMATALLLGMDVTWHGLAVLLATYACYYLFDIYDFEENRKMTRIGIAIYSVNIALMILLFFVSRRAEYFAVYSVQIAYQYIAQFGVSRLVFKNENVLLIGDPRELADALKHLEDHRYIQCHTLTMDRLAEPSALGPQLDGVVGEQKINRIVIFSPRRLPKPVLERLFLIKIDRMKVDDYVSFYENLEGKVPVERLDEDWFLFGHGFSILHSRFEQRIKRIVDIAVALSILLISFPFMLLSALIIKLGSKGPVFFIQKRIGLNGRKFSMVKFRSMRMHDPSQHSQYAEDEDVRITRFGGFMRRMRIDELPQIFNILVGDMSFIGPRAEWDKLSERYGKTIPYYNLRHAIKPGATGWAQVNYPYGASLEDAVEKLKYDFYYLKHYSWFLELIILLRTVKIVLSQRGK